MYYSLEKGGILNWCQTFRKFEAKIKWLLTDSRSLAFPETTLFLHHARGAAMATNI